ncbi:family transcriptional regulator [Leptolyngbya sp. Heron Island J]|uniref:GntR family transcriptional regulator n=1 Tax=Leptolyngbya sp. Heron Island J TaxID=1385935 RepID=UPI0003B968CF|nr:GntR family transcriptional regulator [Leptolyngbya sp. Heron Island J]ESA35706.1 family transcriptional regulator [Leptolyngbya sp. Heron Island J]
MSSVPLHISISEKLRQQIESGDYLPGEKLPSEHQLMATFNVSRITVRRAVANLVNQGLAKAQQGKGVFVTPQKKVAYSLSSPLTFIEQDLAKKGIRLTFENLTFRKVKPSKRIQTILQLTDKPSVYLQKKLLCMDSAVGAVDISYILLELGQEFGPQLKQQMTFPTLEAHGIIIEQIDAVIECTHADYEMSGYLAVPLGQPLIVYRYTAYTRQQCPILHGETISRADRFCYSLSLQK